MRVSINFYSVHKMFITHKSFKKNQRRKIRSSCTYIQENDTETFTWHALIKDDSTDQTFHPENLELHHLDESKSMLEEL